MITALRVPAVRIDWMIRPGSAPMYVRRCPRISASSRMPPRDMRTNFLSRARAIDRPSEVLPTPGGPTKHRIGVCNERRFAPVRGADSGSWGDSGAGGDAGGSADPWLGAEL